MKGYYDAMFTGLVKCEALRRVKYEHSSMICLEVRVLETKNSYRKGELMQIPPRYFVNRRGQYSGGHLKVSTVDTSSLPLHILG